MGSYVGSRPLPPPPSRPREPSSLEPLAGVDVSKRRLARGRATLASRGIMGSRVTKPRIPSVSQALSSDTYLSAPLILVGIGVQIWEERILDVVLATLGWLGIRKFSSSGNPVTH